MKMEEINHIAAVAAASGDRPNRRRKYVVNAAFQWKFAAVVGLMVFLIASTMSSVIYGVLHHQARLRMIHAETYVAEVSLVVLLSGLAFSALTAGGVAFWCIFVTHRICGPLSVIARAFTELAQGRFPKLRPLRQKDEFKDFYAMFSQAVDSLQARKQADLSVMTEALQIGRSAADGDDITRRGALDLMVRRLDTLRRETAETLGQESNPLPQPSVRKREFAPATVGSA